MKDLRHWIANVIGNLGISFFVPLTSSSVVQSWVNHSVNAYQSVLIAVVTALITTGLSLSYEIKRWSNRGKSFD